MRTRTGAGGEMIRQGMMVRVSDTFGGGCVRCLFQEDEMKSGHKTSRVGDGLSWVMDDTKGLLDGMGWGPETGAAAKPLTQARAIPWASNFLRALHLLGRDPAAPKGACQLPPVEKALRKSRTEHNGSS